MRRLAYQIQMGDVYHAPIAHSSMYVVVGIEKVSPGCTNIFWLSANGGVSSVEYADETPLNHIVD